MGQHRKLYQVVKGAFYFATSPLRILPDFLIIGAMKSGTTSLFNYVCDHPWITPALKKELFFFSNENPFWRNTLWYRAHFPLIFERLRANKAGKKLLTGEATPGYLFHPYSAARVKQTVPQVKLIAVLRNPVDRAYAHYQNITRSDNENLSFEKGLEREREMYLDPNKRIEVENNNSANLHYLIYSYLSRGIYIEQIERWLEFYSRDQMLILESRTLQNDTRHCLELVFNFLGIPSSNYSFPEQFPKHNAFSYPPMNPETRRELAEFFRPYNQRLYDLLGVDFGWESENSNEFHE
jgi:hypothetical protein